MMNDSVNVALSLWGYGDAPTRLIADRENHVYRVDTQQGPVALRVHRNGYRTDAQIESEIHWMGMLADNGLHVPTPIPSTEGKFLQHCAGANVSVMSWVDGVPMSQQENTASTYERLGETLARMHELADAWTVPDSFDRPHWDLLSDTPTWGRYWENPGLTETQKNLFVDFHENAKIQLSDSQADAFGLIHADLVPDNVLQSEQGLQIIDFDDGGFGHRLFDIATVTHRSRRLDPQHQLAEATIAGYLRHRFINTEELGWYEALRACSYVGWNIPRMSESGGQDRNRRFITEAIDAIKQVQTSSEPRLY